MTDTSTTRPEPVTWNRRAGYEDIVYETSASGIARVTINRPEVRNAFRPRTVTEMIRAFDDIRDDASIGVVILTGAGDAGKEAYLEKRKPDFSRFKRYP